MNGYEVRFRNSAVADLDNLFGHLASESGPEIAGKYLARLEHLCLSLSMFPHRGSAVPGRVAGLRVTGFERRASILFRVDEHRVEILSILYGHVEAVLEQILAMRNEQD